MPWSQPFTPGRNAYLEGKGGGLGEGEAPGGERHPPVTGR